MPTLRVFINSVVFREAEKEPKLFGDLAKALTVAMSQLTGVPETSCVVSLAESKVYYGGVQEPCATVDFYNVYNATPEQNDKFTMAFTDILKQKLGIPDNKMYINMFAMRADQCGSNWDGTGTKTLHTLWGGPSPSPSPAAVAESVSESASACGACSAM
eukprot:TRINITY_DN3804_c0_g1_i1.p1 TRINITY_DN3804_c0_g1~~TRINITY_DN3804_c0_g1_i1.p1  ORF type:complete len:159 (-),score=46.12 TRINITY_DN3804_c0_g1_i1:402-878(-)